MQNLMQLRHKLYNNVRYIGGIYLTFSLLCVALICNAAYGIFSADLTSYPVFYVVRMVMDLLGMNFLFIIYLCCFKKDMKYDRGQHIFLALLILHLFNLYIEIFCSYQLYTGPKNNFLLVALLLYFFNAIIIALLFWEYILWEIDGDFNYYYRDLCDKIMKILIVAEFLFVILKMQTSMGYTLAGSGGFDHNGQTYQMYLAMTIGVSILETVIILIQRMHWKKKCTLLTYVFFPLIMILAIAINPKIQYSYIASMLSLLAIFGTLYQQQNHELAMNNEKLVEVQTKLLMSQLNPEFLFNSLASIQGMEGTCEETREAIVDFARYLNDNLDSIDQDTNVPLDHELEHVEAYLNLCKLRYGEDRIKVDYDIAFRDFAVPALSLEILVENAIKHGLVPKEGGGTIRIATYEDEYNCYAEIADDGIGYDPKKIRPEDNVRTHLGVANVTSRIESQCKGKLKLESQIGQGSKSIIIIPKLA